MRFPRQEYWSGLPFPSPGDLPDLGIEPMTLALAGRFFTTGPPGKPNALYIGKHFQGHNHPAKAGDVRDTGSIPGLERSPGERKGYPLQYSGLENSMDYIDHGVTKSQT